MKKSLQGRLSLICLRLIDQHKRSKPLSLVDVDEGNWKHVHSLKQIDHVLTRLLPVRPGVGTLLPLSTKINGGKLWKKLGANTSAPEKPNFFTICPKILTSTKNGRLSWTSSVKCTKKQLEPRRSISAARPTNRNWKRNSAKWAMTTGKGPSHQLHRDLIRSSKMRDIPPQARLRKNSAGDLLDCTNSAHLLKKAYDKTTTQLVNVPQTPRP